MLASDEIGNLTNDGTWSYTWQHGRQLAQMSRPDASGDTEMILFRYDSGGHRIGKDSGVYHASYSGGEIVYAGETTRTSYSYLGDTLTQINIDAPTGSTSLHFTYDELGPMSVTYDGAEYFYLKNAQGDVRAGQQPHPQRGDRRILPRSPRHGGDAPRHPPHFPASY